MCLARAGRAVKSSGITDFTSSYLQITRAKSCTRRQISIIGTRRAGFSELSRISGGEHISRTTRAEARFSCAFGNIRRVFIQQSGCLRNAFDYILWIFTMQIRSSKAIPSRHVPRASKYIVLLNRRAFYKGCSTSWQSVRLNERYGPFCAPICLDANAVESISPYPENNSPRYTTILSHSCSSVLYTACVYYIKSLAIYLHLNWVIYIGTSTPRSGNNRTQRLTYCRSSFLHRQC